MIRKFEKKKKHQRDNEESVSEIKLLPSANLKYSLL